MNWTEYTKETESNETEKVGLIQFRTTVYSHFAVEIQITEATKNGNQKL